MGRSLLGWVAFAALIAAAVVTAGWGSGTSPRPAPDPSPSPSQSAEAAHRLVRSLDLPAGDLPRGFRAGPARERTASPAVCGVPAPGPDEVLASHGQDLRTPDGRRVRTQVVLYADGGGADRALTALRSVVPRCSRPVPPGRTELPSTLALDVTVGGSGTDARHELMVERREDVLVLLRVDHPDDRSAGRAPLAIDLARLLAARLLSR